MRSNRKAAALILLACLSAATARADDPEAKAARRRGASSAARRADAPPRCPRHVQATPAPATPRTPAAGPGFGSMPQVFDEMMASFARNPAGGFDDFLAIQERRAVAEIRLNPTEERQIGRRFREEYLRQAQAEGYPVVRDEARVRYLRDLVEALAPRMAHRDRYPNLDITLIDAPIADGQSFPGGYLVFTTALLAEPDEATVAGVVAHELAHLDLAHLYDMARRARLADRGFAPDPSLMADPGRMMTRGMAVGRVFMVPFRPEQELEADCAATTWLYQEGYDPRALAGFFERLHERTRDQPDHPFVRFARSHPDSLDRHAEVLARLAQLRRWKDRADLGLFAENLRRLVSRPREQGRAVGR